jgi:hypothetical protein
MAELFERRCRVIVDDVDVRELRVSFTVTKTAKKEPNVCEVAISNLNEDTRRRLKGKGSKVFLQAGHEETMGTLFTGDARTVEHLREGPTTLTRIKCGDGERAYAFAHASQGWAAGVRAADVVAYLVTALGVQPGNAITKVRAYRGPLHQFANGYTVHGRASTELNALLKSMGFAWSIQDGALQVLEPGESAQATALVLSPDSGLVGSPEHGTPDKKGNPSVMKCKSTLLPELRPGRRIILDARDTKGTYRVVSVRHRGDTHSGDWHSELECLPE